MPRKSLITSFCIFLIFLSANGQKAVTTSGVNAVGTSGSISYTIGQLDYITTYSATGSTSQGVQQPYISSPLPILLINFHAEKNDEFVSLLWVTSSEINSSKFIVQRSKDGISFYNLNEIQAAGISYTTRQYESKDLHPLNGRNYYRIKLVDKDGSFSYSKVLSINFSAKENIAIVYPNPTKENIILNVKNITTRNLSYRLFSNIGELVANNIITANNTSIDLKHLASGLYYLKIVENNQEIKSIQIIKSN